MNRDDIQRAVEYLRAEDRRRTFERAYAEWLAASCVQEDGRNSGAWKCTRKERTGTYEVGRL